MPLGVAILGIPSSVFGGDDPNTTAQAIVFSSISRSSRSSPCRSGPAVVAARRGRAQSNDFVRIFGPVYLVVLAALWGSALPVFRRGRRHHRLTAPDRQSGYAAVCFVVAAMCVFAAVTAMRPASTSALSLDEKVA